MTFFGQNSNLFLRALVIMIILREIMITRTDNSSFDLILKHTDTPLMHCNAVMQQLSYVSNYLQSLIVEETSFANSLFVFCTLGFFRYVYLELYSVPTYEPAVALLMKMKMDKEGRQKLPRVLQDLDKLEGQPDQSS